ncbi:MAG: hypothetical protein D3923_06685 [Candidatus Electrothrix sp. AR3]|nr:hypothetical protein [Candidatus Electrothrix sp. AR3]
MRLVLFAIPDGQTCLCKTSTSNLPLVDFRILIHLNFTDFLEMLPSGILSAIRCISPSVPLPFHICDTGFCSFYRRSWVSVYFFNSAWLKSYSGRIIILFSMFACLIYKYVKTVQANSSLSDIWILVKLSAEGFVNQKKENIYGNYYY